MLCSMGDEAICLIFCLLFSQGSYIANNCGEQGFRVTTQELNELE